MNYRVIKVSNTNNTMSIADWSKFVHKMNQVIQAASLVYFFGSSYQGDWISETCWIFGWPTVGKIQDLVGEVDSICLEAGVEIMVFRGEAQWIVNL